MGKADNITSIEDFVLPEDNKSVYTCFFEEIWKDDEYNRFGVEISAGDVVLDCGASIGLFSLYAMSKNASEVIAFEMDDYLIPYFEQNTNDYPEIIVENTRIANDGTTFERIFHKYNLNHVDFAKVDIEGSEFELILNMSDETMKSVDKWAIEVHHWGLHSNRATELVKTLAIIEKFSKNGFKCNYEHIHKNTNLGMIYAIKG